MSGPGDQGGVEAAVQQHRAGKSDQAEAALRRLTRRPDTAGPALLALATILIERGRFEPATFELERAVKQWPGHIDLLMLLHCAYIGSKKPEKALEVGMECVRLAPESDGIAMAIASLHLSERRLDAAEEWFEKSLRLNPQNLKSLTGVVVVYSASLRGAKAVALIREALRGPMRCLDLHRLLAFQLQYVSGVDPHELFEAQCIGGGLAAREVDGFPPRLTVDPDPERKLTIGYLSPDFRQHSCAYFFEPLLAARDRSAFRAIAYASVARPDEVTRRLRGLVDVWRDVTTMPPAALAQQIAADKVDVVIDLAGHTGGSRITTLVLRPAPITATYIGFPNTSGTPGIDFRFVDSITDPPGAESLATEKLVRLDPCFLCYHPIADAPPVAEPPFGQRGHITFGSFNVLDKVSDATLDAWAALLKRVPDSRLLLKSRSLVQDSFIARRIREEFSNRGVEPGRIDLAGWVDSPQGHLDAYRQVDIAVDTFPYNGTTTTCEALWMGVPVIALRGRVHAARVGASLLSAVGLADLVAEDADGYVATAAFLAADKERLAALRAGLRQRMASSPLCGERAFVARFENTIRGLWREWCATQRAK